MHQIRHLRRVLVFVFLAFAIWRFWPHLTNVSTLITLKQNLEIFWLICAVVSQLGLYFADGWLSQILLKIVDFKISLINTVRVASLNVFASRFSPVGETGALVTMFYFYRKLGVNTESIIFLSIAWGMISVMTLFLIFIVSILVIPKIFLTIHFPVENFTFMAIFLLILTLVIFKRKILFAQFKKILMKYDWAKYVWRFVQNREKYKNLIVYHWTLILQAILASVIYHLTNVITLAFSFLAFGQLPPVMLLAFVYTVSLVSGWVTLSPGGIGSADAVMVLIFLHFKINPVQVAAAVLTYRLITSLLPIPAALFSYLSIRKNLKN